jgi:hypothetical protein
LPAARQPWMELMFEALLASLEGRFDDDQRLLARVEAMSAGNANAARSIIVHQMLLSRWRGEDPKLPIDKGLGTLGAVSGMQFVSLSLLRATVLGDRESACSLLARVSDEELVGACHEPLFAIMFADGAILADEPRQARIVYDELRGREGRVALASLLGFAVGDLIDAVLFRLAAFLGDVERAERHAHAASALAQRLAAWPWLARLHLDFADALAARGDEKRAAAERAAAKAVLARVDLPTLARRLGDAASATTENGVRLVNEGDFWQVSGFGESAHVKDSRGLRMLARLVAEPGRELHALDLSGASETDGGDAGEVIDETARERYKRRASELRAELDEAEEFGDPGRAERARQELEALTSELARAVGLGGRARRAGSAAERARTNVQRRIAAAVKSIGELCPKLGEHLGSAVRTGTFCSYAP